MRSKAEVSRIAADALHNEIFKVELSDLNVLVIGGSERSRKLSFAIKKTMEDFFAEAEKAKVKG